MPDSNLRRAQKDKYSSASSHGEGRGLHLSSTSGSLRCQCHLPRLPFEPIDAATYEELQSAVVKRRVSSDFFEALQRYDQGELTEAGPAGCDSDKCLLPLAKPEN